MIAPTQTGKYPELYIRSSLNLIIIAYNLQPLEVLAGTDQMCGTYSTDAQTYNAIFRIVPQNIFCFS